MRKAKNTPLHIITLNAKKHYSAGVPVWNPSLGAYYVLSNIGGKVKFLIPTLTTWARLESRGKRKGSSPVRIPLARKMALHHMGLAH